MTKRFQPMLAERKSPIITKIAYPRLASRKYDGLRCVFNVGAAVSRTLKPIPNKVIQTELRNVLDGMMVDGELIVGKPYGNDVLNRTTSGVMSHDGEPDWTYYVFDVFGMPHSPFSERIKAAETLVKALGHPRIKLVRHDLVSNAGELDDFLSECLTDGYEGAMSRSLDGPYKFGRSTAREGTLFKHKIWEDTETLITDVVEAMENQNEQVLDERGYAKRSTAKAGKQGKNTMGAIVCVHRETGATFEIGSGFTDEQRQEVWDMWFGGLSARTTIRSRLVKYKYFGLTPYGVPRNPIFIGFREPGT